MPWLRRLHLIARPFYRVYSRFSRGMTLGVRGLVTNANGEVLLVEHTYTPGWYLPGGGVERGETAEEALVRELQEEAGVRVLDRPVLLTFHSNDRLHRGDHVLLYRVDRWEPCPATAHAEIKAIAWSAPGKLPDGVTAGTRRRIEEALGGKVAEPHW